MKKVSSYTAKCSDTGVDFVAIFSCLKAIATEQCATPPSLGTGGVKNRFQMISLWTPCEQNFSMSKFSLDYGKKCRPGALEKSEAGQCWQPGYGTKKGIVLQNVDRQSCDEESRSQPPEPREKPFLGVSRHEVHRYIISFLDKSRGITMWFGNCWLFQVDCDKQESRDRHGNRIQNTASRFKQFLDFVCTDIAGDSKYMWQPFGDLAFCLGQVRTRFDCWNRICTSWES